MSNKYIVPAIEKMNKVLEEVSNDNGNLRMIDLVNKLGVNKSTMYSILNTMEHLNIVRKNENDRYFLGQRLAFLGAKYFESLDLVDAFYREARESLEKVDECIQFSKLDGNEIFYLAKLENNSRVRVITQPGMKFPAHASAMGKIQLIQKTEDEIRESFRDPLFKKTEATISNVDQLINEVKIAKNNNFAVENEESNEGFHCVAAPVYDAFGNINGGISFAMQTSSWKEKFELSKDEIIRLARRISEINGYEY